jgi:hypothetical protein
VPANYADRRESNKNGRSCLEFFLQSAKISALLQNPSASLSGDTFPRGDADSIVTMTTKSKTWPILLSLISSIVAAPAQLQILWTAPGYLFAFSENEGCVAVADPNQITIHNATNGTVTMTIDLPSQEPLSALAFSPDGKWLLSGSPNWNQWNKSTTTVRHAKTGKIHAVLANGFFNGKMSLTRGQCTAVSETSEGIQLWDLPNGRPTASIKTDYNLFRSIAISANGTFIAADRDTDVRVWRVRDNALAYYFPGEFRSRIASSAFSPDERYLAVSSEGDPFVAPRLGAAPYLKLWRMSDGTLLWRQQFSFLNSVTFSPHGFSRRVPVLLYGDADSLYFLDISDGHTIYEVSADWYDDQPGAASRAAFSPDDELVGYVYGGITVVARTPSEVRLFQNRKQQGFEP